MLYSMRRCFLDPEADSDERPKSKHIDIGASALRRLAEAMKVLRLLATTQAARAGAPFRAVDLRQ